MEWKKIFNSKADMENAMKLEQPRLLKIGEHRICLIRLEDQLCAIEDRCPHNGESLSKGKVNFLGEVVCPWHGQRFDIKTGREGAQRSRDLITYPIREMDGIYLQL